jgi:pyrroloquinoline-quinone synthase
MNFSTSMSFEAQIQAVISSCRLLDHPFYVAWTKGELSLEQLKAYACQYFHFVLSEPTFLSAVHSNTPHFATDGNCDLRPRQMILQNLIDEELGADNHPELWKRFAEALGLCEADLNVARPLPATRRLVQTFSDLCRNRPYYAGLAALHAFESQVPEIAAAKLQGLQDFYGLADPHDVAFFAVHKDADLVHSRVEWSLIERAADTSEKREAVLNATRAVCEALWGFLDDVYKVAQGPSEPNYPGARDWPARTF